MQHLHLDINPVRSAGPGSCRIRDSPRQGTLTQHQESLARDYLRYVDMNEAALPTCPSSVAHHVLVIVSAALASSRRRSFALKGRDAISWRAFLKATAFRERTGIDDIKTKLIQ
jgi:hypothetical protein